MSQSEGYKFNKFLMDMGRVVLSPLILFFRVKKIYVNAECKKQTENLNGALIAANHVGFSDPLILNAAFAGRRFFYTASEEVMSGFKGKLLKYAGCIKIDRQTADLEAIKVCSEILKSGYLLGMFPQGHIGADAAKGGMVLIAAMSGKVIVPAYIEKRHNIFKRQKVAFGQPIDIRCICKRTMPNKNETEEILRLFDERCLECKNVINS